MKTKTLLLCCRILPAVCILVSAASCGDTQEPETDYPVLEGLLAITKQQLQQSSSVLHTGETSRLYFYSETLPIQSFKLATVTIYPLSNESMDIILDIPDNENSSITSTKSNYTILWPFKVQPNTMTPMPDCSDKSYSFFINYVVPEDGSYDFYLHIENPEQNIFYQTPKYRYTKQADERGMYFSTLIPIE